jgi:L-lactate dehydrogenase complex protein LldG
MENSPELIETFTAAAENVSAVVSRVTGMEQAFAYVVDLCDRKEACQLMVSGCNEALSTLSENLCREKRKKVMAAPLLEKEDAERLENLCQTHGIELIRDGLREHLAGLDIALTVADYGIAETGTLVIDSSSEELRLATMISEIHVAVLPTNRLYATSLELETKLRQTMAVTPSYVALITGASRTADIERVLALGVHGPLELHILLLEA